MKTTLDQAVITREPRRTGPTLPRIATERHAAWPQLVARLRAATAEVKSLLSLARRRNGVPAHVDAVLGPGAINLPEHKVIRIARGSGVRRIQVHRGYAWLTSTPAGGDVLLRAGEQHLLS